MDKEDEEKKYIFSKDLRDALAPFGKMDIRDALRSKDFWRAFGKHAGMTDEEFDNCMNGEE